MALKNLSLFTGSGIGDHAAELCGIKTVAVCENDPCCMYCLKRLFPDAKKFKDVRDVSATAVRGLGPIDIISAGPPCQPTSLAGKGKAEKDAKWLWPETLRIVDEIRPPWLFFENPLGIRTRGLDWILAGMESMGYSVWPLVIPAYAAGLRHHRKRIWIVANSNSNGLPRLQDIYEETERRKLLAIEPLALRPWARGLGTLAEVPRFIDGMAGGLLPKARNALLQMVGNGWAFQNAYTIYQWIAAQGKS